MKVDYPAHWAECRFEQVLNYIQPGPYIVESTDYDDSYKIPVLTAGKSFIKGYTNETAGVFSELPVIIFDDFTTATQYVNFPFKVKSSAMKILVPTSSDLNLKFLFYLMQVTHVNADSHKRYWIGIYSKEKVCLPPINEQHRIVAKIEELFSELDKGVESLKKAREQLKVYRQALLKHAFEGKLTEHLPGRQAGWRDPEFRNISDKLVPIDSSQFFAYVLVCEGERLYKGFTSNLFERINQHLLGHGSKFTKDNKPLSLLYFEEFETEQEALDREKYFKSGSGREWLYELKAQQEEKHPTAEQLLERIKLEREARYQQQLEEWNAAVKQWEANGKVGKRPGNPKKAQQTLLPAKKENAKLPELPESFIYIFLSALGDLGRGKSKHRPRNAAELFGGKYPFIQTGEVKAANRIVNDYKQTLSEVGLAQSKLWPKGTLCITIAANIAETAFLGFDGCFPDSVVGFTANERLVHPKYIELFIMSARTRIEAYAPATAQKNINLTTLENIVVPFTSEKEQNQVIEYLDERFSVIDKLKLDIDNNLLKAEALRQSILKKAFSGKLVPQDPNDEPASVLLDRIAEKNAGAKASAKKSMAAKKNKTAQFLKESE